MARSRFEQHSFSSREEAEQYLMQHPEFHPVSRRTAERIMETEAQEQAYRRAKRQEFFQELPRVVIGGLALVATCYGHATRPRD